ncbi:MAG: copper-binding protein [Pirellulales bacterium]
MTAKVVTVDSSKGTVTLDHEDIPGMMRAMQMEFKAAPEVLSSVAPGDAVKGTLGTRQAVRPEQTGTSPYAGMLTHD